MSVERYTLDTNILVYAMDRNAGEKQQKAAQLIHQMMAADCVLTLQSLAEFFRAVTGKGKMPIPDALEQVQDWLTLFPVQRSGPATLTKAMRAVQDHCLSFWDAMLWAAAKEARCTVVLSEDFQDGRVLEGVRFENPFLD
ncbi:MAG: PIN domain-containing protein [Magnetococcales bacterium]|nr:PIN domain-containing protein [Magnetococcales bacterium]